MLFEIDAFLDVDENGIVLAEGESDAWIARLEEWLRTPLGSVYGLPSWGNNMAEFKHEPIGSTTNQFIEVAIEARLMTKLRTDLPGIALLGVECHAISEDQLQLNFNIGGSIHSVIMQKDQERTA